MIKLPNGMLVSVDSSPEINEVLNALLDYSMAQVSARMIAYGEPFEVALANYIKEIENEQVEKSSLR